MTEDIHIENPECRRGENAAQCYLTLGTIRKFLENTKLDDDTPIYLHRVEDVYFANHGWGVVDVLWEDYHGTKQYVNAIGGFNFFSSSALDGTTVILVSPHY